MSIAGCCEGGTLGCPHDLHLGHQCHTEVYRSGQQGILWGLAWEESSCRGERTIEESAWHNATDLGIEPTATATSHVILVESVALRASTSLSMKWDYGSCIHYPLMHSKLPQSLTAYNNSTEFSLSFCWSRSLASFLQLSLAEVSQDGAAGPLAGAAVLHEAGLQGAICKLPQSLVNCPWSFAACIFPLWIWQLASPREISS